MVTMDELLTVAHDMGASDVHISVGLPPKVRLDGALVDIPDYPILRREDTEALTLSIASNYHRTVLEKCGEVDFSYAIDGLGRFRVNIFKQRNTHAAVLRLISSDIPLPEQLGMPNSMINLIHKKRGLVLVTGPTGSGKSTTLAALIGQINQLYPYHIITLEDPIEYLHTHKKAIVNQREMGLDSINYQNALRVALREDPDVILVGEMSDLETISTAITAAETGHLVFSTLHTTGAASTIDRIIDVFPSHQQQQIRIQLASVLEAVISQTLIPHVSGKGRRAAFEVMIANPAIKNLIREQKTHQINATIQTHKKDGMLTLDDALFDLYARGEITGEQAVNYSQDPINMMKKLF